MKNLKILFAFFVLAMFTACSDEVDLQNNAQETLTRMNDTTSCEEIIFINDESDIIRMKDSLANSYEKKLLNEGWKKVETTFDKNMLSRAAASIRIDTIYTNLVSIEPTYETFKAKFGKAMVDAINAEVRPELKISTSKTYLCHWDVLVPFVNLAANEQPGLRDSPYCALNPDKKETYTERGYSGYTHTSSNGKRQYQMTSYKLNIKCEAVSHVTTILDIDWPFPKKNESGYGNKGYEFIYAILTL